MLDNVMGRIRQYRKDKAYEIIDRDHEQAFAEWYEWWQHTPEAAVKQNLDMLTRDQLIEVREDIERKLRKKEDNDRKQTADKLNQLTLALAEYMQCSRRELQQRGRKLELEEKRSRERQREQDRADARAAVERGEINDVSEYIPF